MSRVRMPSWLPLSREGLIWLVISAAMLIMGLIKGINLVTMLACWMFVLVSWNAWHANRQLRFIRAVRLFPDPLFARTAGSCVVEVHNEGQHAARGLRIEDGAERILVREAAPGLRVSRPMTLSTPRRGRLHLPPLEIFSGYPLGLVNVSRTMAGGDDVIVFPRLGQVHTGSLRRFVSNQSPTQGDARTVPRHHAAAQMEFHGLRPFRSGDSPRWIHWRTSARLGNMMVREFEDVPSEHLTLAVEPWTAHEGQDDPLLERLLSFAATVCWEWCRQTGDRLALLVAGKEPVILTGITGQPLACRLLEALALAQGTPAPNTEALAAALINADLPPGPVLLLSTRPSGVAHCLEQTLNRRVASLQLDLGEEAPFFEDTESTVS